MIPKYDDCLNLCKGEVTCQWFSYDLTQRICILLYTCPELNENFKDYLSGEVDCPNQAGKYQNFKFKLICFQKLEKKHSENRLIRTHI